MCHESREGGGWARSEGKSRDDAGTLWCLWTPGCLSFIVSPPVQAESVPELPRPSCLTRHACHLEALARHGDRGVARKK